MFKKLLFIIISLLITGAAFSQSVDGALKTLVASGTDTYTVSEPLPAGYVLNERFIVRFTNANTGAATLNRNGLGAKSIVKNGSTALAAGDIVAGQAYIIQYNGTNYQIVNTLGGGGGGWGLTGTSTLTGPVTIAGSTSNTVQYTFPSLGQSHVTPGVGLWLKNPTTATNILNQNPPSITLEGSGWKTNATAGAQSAQFQIEGIINTGAAKPSIGISMYDVVNGVRGTAVANISKLGNSFEGSSFSAHDSGATFSISGDVTGVQVSTNTDAFISGGAGVSGLQLLDPAGSNATAAGNNIVLQSLATTGTNGIMIVSGDYAFGGTDIAGVQITNGGGSGGKNVNISASDATGLNSASISVDYGSGILINTSNGPMTVLDQTATPRGFEYSADYSATYSNRSLVDRAYVVSAKTYNDKQTFFTSTTGTASINIPHGVAPTTPVNGDIWTTTTGMFARINGATVGPFGAELTNTATLDFPSTTSTTVSDLTITVTGASVGDAVYIGVPNGSVTATGTFWGWVSAANTVKIRFSPKATEDPASGTFRATVYKP